MLAFTPNAAGNERDETEDECADAFFANEHVGGFILLRHNPDTRVPKELLEASTVDGAGAWSRFWHVTVPSLRGIIVITTTLQFIWGLNEFAIIWAMTNGGPGNATNNIVVNIYRTGFLDQNISYAATMGVIWLVILLAFTYFYIRSSNSRRRATLAQIDAQGAIISTLTGQNLADVDEIADPFDFSRGAHSADSVIGAVPGLLDARRIGAGRRGIAACRPRLPAAVRSASGGRRGRPAAPGVARTPGRRSA